MNKTFIKFASAAVIAGGVGVFGFGPGTGVAQAAPEFAPVYHWCPGDQWDPSWGDNWEWGACHDDHHRDFDGDDHRRDHWDDRDRDRWRDDQPPMFCIPFVNCPPPS
jgi:hypothetical protein